LAYVRSLSLFTALLLSAALVACGGGGNSDSGSSDAPVTVALDFVPNAAHAGIYAGREGGSGNPPLTVRVPSGSTDSIKLLLSRRADMSVVDIHDLGLAREKGQDIVGVGALVQRPLAAVIARSNITRPRELEGKRVGVTGLPSDLAVLRAVVENDGGNFDKVRKITIGFAAVKALAAGKVDAVVAFWNVEGVTLKREGVPTREFRVDDYGAPHYPELVLAVRGEELRNEQSRKRVAGALGSIADGTRAALREPRDAIATVSQESQSNPGLVAAEMDAIRPALSPPVVLDRAQLDAWAKWDARFGILKAPPDVSRAFVSP
jgi:NitT/TauT family transport system substrate-binding protein/putative hydroxymethylpyrimidine transport system substrate-binding protein